MKKLISGISALVIMTAMAVPFSAFADDRGAVISTEIEPTYLVTIPADVKVVSGQEKTDFGAVTLEKAQIEPDKCVKVTLVSDNLLKHQKDKTKTLAYTISEKVTDAETTKETVFTSAVYQTAGEKTDLTIGISKEEWEKAYAGTYSNTVTFKIEYADISTEKSE